MYGVRTDIVVSYGHLTDFFNSYECSGTFKFGVKPVSHCWAHGSNTVYSVIHGLTGTSIELQPCLGISWYNLDSNVARVCTNKARIYSVKQGLSRFEHDLHTIFIRLLYGSKYGLVRSSTIKHDFYSINWTFTGFTYGPADFCSSYARIITHSCMF